MDPHGFFNHWGYPPPPEWYYPDTSWSNQAGEGYGFGFQYQPPTMENNQTLGNLKNNVLIRKNSSHNQKGHRSWSSLHKMLPNVCGTVHCTKSGFGRDFSDP
ncbi:unnamed protein product [Linum trigynum]|uniref:Uncharacterized protein n=1 Tax=Linum trigynum TaxID=586398 RepID=A0AAV2FTE1_9ROSI